MKCENCGVSFADGLNNCPNCGALIFNNNFSTDNLIQQKTQSAFQVQTENNMHPPKKKVNPLVIIICVLVAVIAIVGGVLAFVLVGNSSSDLKIDTYISTELKYTGTNGAAGVSSQASDIVDYNKLYFDLVGSSKNAISFSEAEKAFDYAFDISVPDNKDLKNDDNVDISISVKYDIINDKDNGFEKKLSGDDSISRSYIVSGLSDKAVIDVFEVVKSVKHDKNNKKTTISYDKTYENKVGDYTVKYSDSNNARLTIKNADGTTVATVSFSADYDSGKKATVNAEVDAKVEDNGYTIDEDSKVFSVSVVEKTTKKQTTTKAPTKSYDFVTNMNSIDYDSYSYFKKECLGTRCETYPDAYFVCSYFVFNSNYYSQNVYKDHAINGINFVFYSEKAGGYVTCSAFNIYKSGGSVNRLSTNKYPGYYVGKKVYSDPYDGYTSQIRYSGSEKNWTSIELIEEA